MLRVWIIGLTMGLGVLQTPLALAVVAGPAPEQVERGYAHLTQAHAETDSTTREHLLTAAITAFKKAYQTETAGPAIRVQALLGAAQALLRVQSPRRVFPFLWQATPLQRAEKNLQQTLVLQQDNAAAALLLGIVYQRQAAQVSTPAGEILARSRYYLTQAANLGLPVRLSPAPEQQAQPVRQFGVDDTVLALRYIDVRGVGRMEDLLFIYHAAARTPMFGVIVISGHAYPLIWDSATGALAPHGLLEAITVIPQPDKRPILVIRLQQETNLLETRFAWDGTHIVSILALP